MFRARLLLRRLARPMLRRVSRVRRLWFFRPLVWWPLSLVRPRAPGLLVLRLPGRANLWWFSRWPAGPVCGLLAPATGFLYPVPGLVAFAGLPARRVYFNLFFLKRGLK